MAPYLTNSEIATRLSSRFVITATITLGDADIASDDLDAGGPFIGDPLVEGQGRAFPRDKSPDGADNTSTTIPDAILDWVALRAYQLSTDEGPAVKSEGAGGVSVTYADPKASATEKRMRRLLAPYQRVPGGISDIEAASTFTSDVRA